jgi:hypothetical protein
MYMSHVYLCTLQSRSCTFLRDAVVKINSCEKKIFLSIFQKDEISPRIITLLDDHGTVHV